MRHAGGILTALALVALASCVGTDTGTARARAPEAPPPSAQSQALRTYYARVQNDLLARGLMRTDGGGPDTPFTPDMLARNFERIAFYDEYELDRGLRAASGQAGQLRRWPGPVRVAVEFGPSVPKTQRNKDRETIAAYVPRLAAATGHPVTMTSQRANFFVLIMGEDDRDALETRVRELVPGASNATLNLFRDVPRNIHCFVAAFSSPTNLNHYTSAIALIRAEHPDLLRESCIHEEIAQGLGLANDSPDARPSIFNDDDEFALLTTQDEKLLSILYDDRLAPGMSLEQARPVIRILAREQTGRIY